MNLRILKKDLWDLKTTTQMQKMNLVNWLIHLMYKGGFYAWDKSQYGKLAAGSTKYSVKYSKDEKHIGRAKGDYKIYVILQNKKEPMHFNDIASAISSSKFRKKDVTLQAIHNELIKDPRFVLIGRGIYALRDWGYKKGTVSQIITSILEEAKTPLTREEIVKNVLKVRKVKETTVLLNLQNKKLYQRVDKNTYTVARAEK